MATDKHSSHDGLPVHSDVSFETRDVNINSVLWSLVYLAVTIVISLAICVWFLKATSSMVAKSEKPVPVIRQQMSESDQQHMTMPPEPRLQGVPGHETDPQQDLRNKIARDTQANESYRWVDEKAGIAQIPVKEAMKIIAEKGLPPLPPPAPEKKQ